MALQQQQMARFHSTISFSLHGNHILLLLRPSSMAKSRRSKSDLQELESVVDSSPSPDRDSDNPSPTCRSLFKAISFSNCAFSLYLIHLPSVCIHFLYGLVDLICGSRYLISPASISGDKHLEALVPCLTLGK